MSSLRHRGFSTRQILSTGPTWKSLYVLIVDCLFLILDCQLQGAGSLAHSLLYCLSLEHVPGTGALSICVLKENGRPCPFHLHSLHLAPQISPPLAPEILAWSWGINFWPLDKVGKSPRSAGVRTMPVDLKTSLRPLLSGSPFLFSKQEKQFSGPSTTWCCFGASYREESPPPLQLFWGRGRSPASEGRIGCGRGTEREAEQVGAR